MQKPITNRPMKPFSLLPVLMTFVVMGFVDIVGVSTGYVRQDFHLSNQAAQLLPMMVFGWFLLLSVPTGILQDRFGKKRAMVIGIFVTTVAMVLPFVHYSFPMMLVTFILLGVGNTMIQVAANPLLQDAVPAERLSGFLSFSQFLKAITSLLGPLLATYAAMQWDNWKLVFAVYALFSVSSLLWLSNTTIRESIPKSELPRATFRSAFSLLSNGFVALMAGAIFLIVGADVGMNANIQGFLIHLHQIPLEQASYGISIYFTALLISRFVGAFLLMVANPRLFLLATTAVAIGGLFILWFSSTMTIAYVGIFVIGIGAGNLFPLIFSVAISRLPERVNELSSLMIMAITGGAIIPPAMGFLNDIAGAVASFSVLLACFLAIWFIGSRLPRR
ncbi:MFS transporter [Parapedobacter koreensis]|uniref:Fucose permease n=1 Tax=Parapedobacter koreensis TaxID=332977 RepID=A0A1H7L2U4_9SPHI|nr:MFS transporter [Parapedobacter koreensis]SEK93321.1 Fucose permease [Parapedobacter koreensis]